MNLKPITQTKLYCLDNYLCEFVKLYEENILPNKILLTGLKGSGKSTLAYHFVNYISSQNEKYPYDLKNFSINENNKSFKLILNNILPNFYLIDIKDEKKNIDIDQIRDMILYSNKSSFNNKPKIILIDNIEYLNKNSINALLKIIEEPNKNVYFILINHNKKVLQTLKSRCLEFRIFLDNKKSISVVNEILDLDITKEINLELLNYYQTPGVLYYLYKFAKENEIDLKILNLENFLNKMINEKYYRKNPYIKKMTFEYIEMFFRTKIKSNDNWYSLYSYFLKYFKNMNMYNLDEESFFIEFKSKILNG